jgi:Sigma-70, region 4
MNKTERAARDKEILALVRDTGFSNNDAGRMYGITGERVRQILVAQGYDVKRRSVIARQRLFDKNVKALRRIVEKGRPPCGTEPGYASHIYRGEKACRACKDAHAEHTKKYYHDTGRSINYISGTGSWDNRKRK